jgi:hypothetical protein
MKKDKQRLWDFEPKTKRKKVNSKPIEISLIFLSAGVATSVGIYLLFKLITFLLE